MNHIRSRPEPVPELVYARYSLMSEAPVLAAAFWGRPSVLEVNGLSEWFSREFRGWRRALIWPLIRRIERRVTTRASLCIAISEPVAGQLEGLGVARDRILVQRNGVDPDRFPEDLSGESVRRAHGLGASPVVGFVGTFGDWHGAENLVRAIPSVLTAHPGARFLFVGDGARKAPAQELGDGLGVGSACVFTGLIPQESAPPYLAACDVLVAPHSWNPSRGAFIGSPTKIFEYMAAGKGIVASRLGQIGEIIEDEMTGLLVPPDDIESLAKSIARLLSLPALAREMGLRARETALKRHSWRTNVEEIVDRLRAEGGR